MRKRRVRAKITGTSSRPRLSVFRSSKYIYAQLIDDATGKTFGSISEKNLSKEDMKAKKTERALKVGELIAQKAKENKITSIVFDRNGYLYHGRVKALAEGARKGGLIF